MREKNVYARIEDLNPGEERSRAVVTHFLALLSSYLLQFFALLAPLVAYLFYKNRGKFIRHHVTEAFNFTTTMLLAGLGLVSLGIISILSDPIHSAIWTQSPMAALMFFFLTWPGLLLTILVILLAILQIVFTIIAAIKTSSGKFYRYPLSIRFIKNNSPMPDEAIYAKVKNLTPSQESSRSVATHLLVAASPYLFQFFTLLAPLGAYLLYKNRGKFIRHHVTEALNFTITIALIWLGLASLSIVSSISAIYNPALASQASFLAILLNLLMIWQTVFGIIAAYKANHGNFYRYPISIRFIKNNSPNQKEQKGTSKN